MDQVPATAVGHPQVQAWRHIVTCSAICYSSTALTLQAGEGKGAGAGAGVDVMAEEEVEGAEQGAVLRQAGQGRAGEGGHRHGELGQVAASCTVTLHQMEFQSYHITFRNLINHYELLSIDIIL